MQYLGNNQRLILHEIVKSGGKLFIYNINRKYYISPGLISKTIRNLEEKKLVVTNDLIVQLSEKGKKLVYTLGLRRQAQVNKPWRKCPEEFKQTKIDISTPYAPKISSLDKEIVSKILRNKNGS